MIMGPFETRATNIMVGIGAADHRIRDFGYDDDPVEHAVSAIRASYITWLVACVEAMAQDLSGSPSASFRSHVIDKLPDLDDPNWEDYILPKPKSSLRRRLEALWGIRVAFTHSDGRTDMISNVTNRGFAEAAPKHINGVELTNNRLCLQRADLRTPTRSIVQVRDLLARGLI